MLQERMYWYGHVVAAACCNTGWISAQCGVLRLISVEKDWKHVLMQKVVTLNTYCDTVCLTFQLPHITTGSFQSHRWQPTTGSFENLQRLKECNKPSVRWKSFAIHKLVWWHFWWFFGFLKVKWLHLTGEVDKSVRFSYQIFPGFNAQKSLKSVNFWQGYWKNKRWTFLGTQCTVYTHYYPHAFFKKHTK